MSFQVLEKVIESPLESTPGSHEEKSPACSLLALTWIAGPHGMLTATTDECICVLVEVQNIGIVNG